MTETQDVKFNVPDHTTQCKSVKCNCNFEDLPKICSIRLLITEMQIEILKGKIIEVQYKNLTEEVKGEADEMFETVADDNKRLKAENLKLKKMLEKSKPQKKGKKTKNDEEEDD